MPQYRPIILFVASVFILWATYAVGSRFYVAAQVKQANLLMIRSKYGEALQVLAKTNRIFPGQAEVHYQMAVAFRRLDKIPDYRAQAAKAKELGLSEAHRLETQELLLRAQSGDLAAETELLQRNDQYNFGPELEDQCFEALAKGNLAKLNYQKAENWIGIWIKSHPETVSARIWIAEIARRKGNTNVALQKFKEVHQQAPDHVDGNREYAIELLKANSVDEAVRVLEACLQFNPNEADLLATLIECRYRQSDMEETERLCHELISAHPTKIQRSVALTYLGKICTSTGRHQEAADYLEEAITIDRSQSGSFHALAMAYRFLDNKEKAEFYSKQTDRVSKLTARVTDLRNELSRDSGNITLKDLQKMYELAEVLDELGSENESAMMLTSLLKSSPPGCQQIHANALHRLAIFYRNQGRHDLARDRIDAANRMMQIFRASQETSGTSAGPEANGG